MKAAKPEKKPFFTNNARRAAGLPTRRKASKHKRFYTRCEASEAIAAFLDFCDGENKHSYFR